MRHLALLSFSAALVTLAACSEVSDHPPALELEATGEAAPAGAEAPLVTGCNPGWSYCGEHPRVRALLLGDGLATGDLYRCNADGSVTLAETCAAGCEVRPAAENDRCKVAAPSPTPPSGSECSAGYWYCGSHPRAQAAKVPSSADLYFCDGGSFTRVQGQIAAGKTCAQGCVIDPADGNDWCAGANTVTTEVSGVPLYAQGDPRWGATTYAVSECGGEGTIAFCGCTLAAVSMAASWVTQNPAITPACINTQYGYALTLLRNVRHLGDAIGYPLTYTDESNGYRLLSVNPDPNVVGPLESALLAEVRASIAAGHPVILGLRIDYFGGGWSRHTVVAVGVTGDGDLALNDPSSGTVSRLSTYRHGSKGPFRGYDRADAVRPPASLPTWSPCY